MNAHPARFFHAFLFGGLAVSVLAIAGLVASAAMAQHPTVSHAVRAQVVGHSGWVDFRDPMTAGAGDVRLNRG